MLAYEISQQTIIYKLTNMSLAEKDIQTIWHPCAQMKEYEHYPPLEIHRALGSKIELKNGKKIIDAISSWWCKSLGHNHPRLKKVMMAQIEKFEHVMFAHTTNEPIVSLSLRLTQLIKGLNRVFYAGDGSCAVEVAIKMCWQARQILNDHERHLFVALSNGYHGETLGALSVSDVGLYRKSFQDLLFKTEFIFDIPYVSGIADPLWSDAEFAWKKTEKFLEPISDRVSAIILEPIVQGGGGMKIYSADWLRRLRQWTKDHGIYLIADEIMTGIGRTGKMLACDYADVEPDFLCLGKGLTSGWMPFSAILTKQSIYDLFYANYEENKSFLHSHTFSGHVLGACVANEVFQIFSDDRILDSVSILNQTMLEMMNDIAKSIGCLSNVRGIGAMVAAEVTGYQGTTRFAFEFAKRAAEQGVLLRPLGSTLYWLPPLNIEYDQLCKIQAVSWAVLNELVS
jgi:adenosylmethionine-8-amino-7-oxononanoate aminotransferase